MGLFEIGAVYPPKEHQKRINRYSENTKLFKGEHADVLNKIADKNDFAYLVVNLPSLICKKYADFLFGEEPTFSAGKDDKSEEQKTIDRLVNDNKLHIKNYKSSLSNSYKGDSFYKIRWGQTYNGLEEIKVDPFKVIIDTQNPEIVFPETVPGDFNTIYVYHIAYPMTFKRDGKDCWNLIVESHYPNRIINSKFEMNATKTMNSKIVEWTITNELPLDDGVIKEIKTGISKPLIKHVPNFQTDDSWEGIDDINDLKSQFAIINNRISQLQNVLDKHADPALVVPSGILKEDEKGELVFNISRDKVFEINEKGEILPQYVVWDAKIDAVFKDIEQAVNHLLMLAEIPPVALGLTDSGTSGASGLSVKFRMNSLLAKVKRKRQFYNEALKDILTIAQELEHAKLGKKKLKYEVTSPRIGFKDGLPNDEKEDAIISQILTGGQQIFSVKTILMDKYGYTEEQADIEIQRMIDEETKRYGLPQSSLDKKLPVSLPEDNQNPDRKGIDN
jgi:hypothetical protein